ncbi:Hypothetical predicted protein, partial [Olea europaea subsp. europaea]
KRAKEFNSDHDEEEEKLEQSVPLTRDKFKKDNFEKEFSDDDNGREHNGEEENE